MALALEPHAALTFRDTFQDSRHMFEYESVHWEQGLHCVAGLDEVGYGAIAGPVAAAAVILPPHTRLEGVRDSKLIGSVRQRERLHDLICHHALDVGIGLSSPAEIDKINVLEAALRAMLRAIENLKTYAPQHLLIDGIHRLPNNPCPQTTIKSGDNLSHTIAAASIIAKVTRDRIMRQLHKEHPEYGWITNVGYKSAKHREAIRTYGPTQYHRQSFTLL